MKQLLILILFIPCLTYAQQFEVQDSISINEEEVISLNWIDIDKDGQPNPIVQINNNSTGVVVLYDSVQGMSSDTLIIPGLTAHPLQFIDVNNDNSLEIIGLLNEGDSLSINIFEVESNSLNNIYNKRLSNVKSFHISDWNNDGYKDILIQEDSLGTGLLKLIPNSRDGFQENLNEVHVFNNLQVLSFIDLDKNGRPDIISFPKNKAGATLIFNHSDTHKTDSIISEDTIKNIAFGDISLDGKLDLFLAGSSKSEILYEDQGSKKRLTLDTLSFEGTIISVFMADFTSDGYLDVFISHTPLNLISESYLLVTDSAFGFNKRSLNFSEKSRFFQFFDEDYDGDLDILELEDKDRSSFTLHKNVENKINSGPSAPYSHTVITTAEKSFLVWSSAFDDHSDVKTLTYDIQIGTDENITDLFAPDFNTSMPIQRIKAKRGNMLYENILEIKDSWSGKIHYAIQSIDNSLSVICNPQGGGNCGTSSDCLPGVACGNFQICSPDSIEFSNLYYCEGDPLVLRNDTIQTAWYSSNQGFLGISKALQYNTTKLDTVYYNSTANSDCSGNSAYVIIPVTDSLFKNESEEFCVTTTINLNKYTELDSAVWVSLNGMQTDTLTSEMYSVVASDTLIAYQYSNACLLADSLTINYDTTAVTITNGDLIEITEGDELQLNAINADSYYWSPNLNINDVESPQPIVSPLENIIYYVEGYKNGTCQTIDSIRIKVKKEAFIPELFTPNNDGTNDKLLIYGLNQVEGFHFQIYNRKGNLVFETTDAEFMRSSGWNGESSSGPAQSGIYYWRVSGSFTESDQELKLNNSKEGKVHLTR